MGYVKYDYYPALPILFCIILYNVNKRVHPNNACMYDIIYFNIIYIFVCVQAAAGLDLKENLAAGATWPYHSVYHPYDAAFGYPFNGWVPPKIHI